MGRLVHNVIAFGPFQGWIKSTETLNLAVRRNTVLLYYLPSEPFDPAANQ